MTKVDRVGYFHGYGGIIFQKIYGDHTIFFFMEFTHFYYRNVLPAAETFIISHEMCSDDTKFLPTVSTLPSSAQLNVAI